MAATAEKEAKIVELRQVYMAAFMKMTAAQTLMAQKEEKHHQLRAEETTLAADIERLDVAIKQGCTEQMEWQKELSKTMKAFHEEMFKFPDEGREISNSRRTLTAKFCLLSNLPYPSFAERKAERAEYFAEMMKLDELEEKLFAAMRSITSRRDSQREECNTIKRKLETDENSKSDKLKQMKTLQKTTKKISSAAREAVSSAGEEASVTMRAFSELLLAYEGKESSA